MKQYLYRRKTTTLSFNLDGGTRQGDTFSPYLLLYLSDFLLGLIDSVGLV